MKVAGKIYKEGSLWIAEVPAFDAMTQGKSKKDAEKMLIDWFDSLLEESAIEAVKSLGEGEVIVTIADTPAVFGLLLQRQRLKSGLTVREAAAKLGFKGHNAYAAYEQGKREPTLSMADKLLKAVSSDGVQIVLKAA